MAKDIHISGIEGGSGQYWVGMVNQVASGMQATMNKYMKIFLTEKDSDPFDPNGGTNFAFLPGSNMGSRLDLVKSTTAESVKDAEAQLVNKQLRQPIPLNERLLSATLSSFASTGSDAIEVSIVLKNYAGEKIQVLLPHVVL